MLTLICLPLLGNMSQGSCRVSESSCRTEHFPLVPGFLAALRQQDADSSFPSVAFSSWWNFQTCNLRGLLFLSVCCRQTGRSMRAPNMEQGLQKGYSFLAHLYNALWLGSVKSCLHSHVTFMFYVCWRVLSAGVNPANATDVMADSAKQLSHRNAPSLVVHEEA